MFISVDLPEPDAPTRAISSPSFTRRSSPWSACTSTPSVVKTRTSRSQAMSASCPYEGRSRRAVARRSSSSRVASPEAPVFPGPAVPAPPWIPVFVIVRLPP